MNDSKSIFQSVTFYGVVVSVLNAFLPHIGFKLDNAGLQDVVQSAVTLIGAAITIYGRLRASKVVTLTGK